MSTRGLAIFSLGLISLVAAQDIGQNAPDNRTLIPHQVVRVTGKETIMPAEVSVVIRPDKPDQVTAITHSARGSIVCQSLNGGTTWKNSLFPQAGNTRQQGDDLLVYGSEGTLYHACIRFVGIRQRKPRRAENGIFLHSFRDDQWSSPVPVVDHVNTVEPFEDKPWLAVDTQPGSKFKGHLYVAWTRFDTYGSKEPDKKSHLVFARSTNGGKSFLPVECLSETPGDCLDSSNTLMGGMPAVGPQGEVYVIWSGPAGIMFTRSLDGGNTFSKESKITDNPGGWDQPAPGMMRHNGLPVITVDTSNGPYRGTLYITWIDKRHGDLDVFCCQSHDQGKTWSSPVRINNDAQGNGKAQLFHWTALDSADGSLNVIFYDRRAENGTKTTMTMARSIDGGKTFANYAVQQPSFECYADVFFGDYIGIAAQQGRIAAVYSHFTGRRELALSAALFRFKPGTLDTQ